MKWLPGLLLLLLTAPAPAAEISPEATEYFSLRSHFWINLHHYLRGCARRQSCLKPDASLSDADKAPWERAIAHYQKEFAERDLFFDEGMVRIKNQLATAGSTETLEAAGLDPAHRELLISAAPVYRKQGWPDHDAANQKWIAASLQLLSRFGNAIAADLTSAYEVELPTQPVTVDVTIEAGWSGAYTTENPPHITIASSDPAIQGYAALEMLFHEISHAWDARLIADLESTAKNLGTQAPPNLWHDVIFFTAGEITRKHLGAAGIRYIPYAYANGLYDRDMKENQQTIERIWQQRIDGKISYAEACRKLIQEIEKAVLP